MAGFYSAFLDPNVKPKYKIKKDYGDTVTPAIAGFIGGMIRDTAVSSGQVVNEAFGNPYLSPVGSLFGKDFLANQVGKVNKAAGESMKGEVTPMDIVNVASLIPNPAGLGIKAASGVGRIAAKAVPKTTFMEPVFSMAVGGTTTRTPLNSTLNDLLSSKGTKVGAQTAAPALQGANVLNASSEAVLNPTGQHRSGKTNQAVQAKRERERSSERLEASTYASSTKSTGLKAREWGAFANEAAEANPRYIEAKLKSRPPWWKFVYNRKVNYDMLPQEIKYYMDQVAGKEWESGHNLRSGLRGSVTHIVSSELNQLAQTAKDAGVKVLTDKNYRPILEWAYANNPKYAQYDSVEHLADALGANHLMGYSPTKLKRIIAGDFN